MVIRYVFLSALIGFSTMFKSAGQSLQLIVNGKTPYSIVVADDAGKNDKAAAAALQMILKSASGIDFPLQKEATYRSGSPAIFIGRTEAAKGLPAYERLKDDGYLQVTERGNLFITGRHGHGTEYGVYNFAERYIGCRKYDSTPVLIPHVRTIELPQQLNTVSNPSFVYRESYYPMSNDAEYLNWHGLQRFEDLWGLWGHSYFKLVPPKKYFTSHPEYYALVNGSRRTTQLCLSNNKVLEIVIAALKQRMAENPDAEYWSVSPEDGNGYCTCDLCKKTDTEEGSPAGSLMKFVNKVAAAFPDKKITTLAYGYAAKAPSNIRPAGNVIVLLSTIDAFREQPLNVIPSAADFREHLKEWQQKGAQVYIWDYCTQFTNYVSPFPVIQHIGTDLKFFSDRTVSGVFEQGSGATYADCAELNSYVQAKLLWNADLDAQALITDFCEGYYKQGSRYVLQYLTEIKRNLDNSGKHLDIYGNPILEMRSFLQPEQLLTYQQLLDKASNTVNDPVVKERIARLKLPLEYAALQQSRSFGPEPYGFLQTQANKDQYKIRDGFVKRVADFVMLAKANGVKELSEGGLTPDGYLKEWQSVFNRSWLVNGAYGAKLTLQNPFVEDYPAKGLRTLTDGMTGFDDFSYNWLCFYGSDMLATIDMGKEMSFSTIMMNFLDDSRHWIFLPESINIAYSSDGIRYVDAGSQITPLQTEHDNITKKTYSFNIRAKARYIKVTAKNQAKLPAWRNYSNKKPMIACDEIFVLP